MTAAKMVTAQLEEHERQKKASIGAVMTVTAANGISQHRQVLKVTQAQAGEAKLRSVATRTDHGRMRIRAEGQEIQRAPTEELLPGSGIRTTLASGVLRKE